MSCTTVRFHRDLYQRAAIEEAAALFAEFARFGVGRDGEHFVVTVNGIDAEVEGDVVAEFCNFALANSANALRGLD
ncbi:MAG TPA: HxsD-like protein [Terriglobales bacterium]|nr:HxsD-like protein [Terriglobales bacterium]